MEILVSTLKILSKVDELEKDEKLSRHDIIVRESDIYALKLYSF